MQIKPQTLWSVSAVAIFTMLALACVTSKTYTSQEKQMRYNDNKVFVERKDGTKLTGNKLKLPVNWMGKSKGMFLDNNEINGDDIVAYQDAKAYHRKFEGIWVKQLKRGRINLYYYETVMNSAPYYDGTKMVNGSSKTTQHFVFQKGNDAMIEANKTQISDLLKDNPTAYAKFNEEFRPDLHLFPKQLQNKPGKLFEIIDIYNQ
jgi:hypothetical protein